MNSRSLTSGHHNPAAAGPNFSTETIETNAKNMKTPFLLTALRHGLLLLLLAGAMHALPGRAQTPPYMTYQGYLTDQNGNALATNGPQAYDIVFRIWPVATGGGTPIYGELQTVTVANGYFSVLLGQGNSYVVNGVTDPRPSLSTVFTTNNVTGATNRYVEMTVKGLANGSDVVILPRLALVTAPYAFMAANANTLVSATTGNTLISSAGTNVTLYGSLTANSIIGNITDLAGSLYLDNGQGIYAKNAAGNYEGFLWPRASDNVTYVNYGSAGFNIRNDNANSVLWMGPGGNVGVGTTSPGYQLDVNGNFHAIGGVISGGSLLVGNSLDNSAGNVGIGAGAYSNVKLRIDSTEDYSLYIDQGDAYLGGNAQVGGSFAVYGTGSFDNTVTVTGSSNPEIAVSDDTVRSEMGIALGTGAYSSAALAHDTVIRNTGAKLILQSGSGAPGIVINTANQVGIGEAPPGGPALTVKSVVGNYGVYIDNSGSTAYGLYVTSGAVWAGLFSGNVDIVGALYKSANFFKIDHPLDPENKYLIHSVLESPDMMNVYNGNVVTDGKGDATVSLPSYFLALNRDFRYQLTVVGQFAQAMVSSEVSSNAAGINFGVKTDKPAVKVSWQVTGIRQDPYAAAHPLQPEVAKVGDEKGKYRNAAEYGKPESMQYHPPIASAPAAPSTVASPK